MWNPNMSDFAEEETVIMTDKERIIRFLNKLIPDDFTCGRISASFHDDGSLFIDIANKEDHTKYKEIEPIILRTDITTKERESL